MLAEGDAASPMPTARIGKYEIVAKIGQGAMGEVYKARDTVLDRFVAIKTMSPAVMGNPEMGQRFLREAQSAARLNHPNVVTLHEFGEDDGRYFMAMELLSGEDLSRLLRRGALRTLDAKLDIMEQILDGVAYAHGSGVIHRDLKPANINVQPNGLVKVMDFGLARLGESEITRTGTVMGTPNYMSPEQVRGERTGPPSDVFALGSLFYELIGGRRAFDADSLHAILYKVAEAEPLPLSDFCANLPPIMVAFIWKALAKNSDQRYGTAGEMRKALGLCRRVLDGTIDEATALGTLSEAPTIFAATAADEGTVLLAAAPDPEATLDVAGPSTGGPSGAGTLGHTLPVSGGRRSPPSPARSATLRTFLYIGVGAVGATVLAGLLLDRVSTPADRQAQTVIALAVESRLNSARRSLEFKDPEGARTAVEEALRFEPDNTQAREILRYAQETLDQAESLAQAAREAAGRGDLNGATAAVSRVLALMPRHPIAAELSDRLAAPIKVATATPTAVKRPGAEPARVTAVNPVVAVLRPAVAAPASTPTPPPALPSAPAVVVVPTPMATLPAPHPVPQPVRNDDDDLRQVISSLKRAIEEKDLTLYKRLRPSLTAEEERRLRDAFRNVASQEVDYRIDSITMDGRTATVRVTRTGRVAGRNVPAVQQVLRLVRGEGGWEIREIGQ